MYSYVIRMSLVCTRMSSVCHSYVIHMLVVCTRMSSVFHSYVLVCHPHVTRMYYYVIRMSLVCTRMSSVCHLYVLVCHPYVTCMYSYVICMSLVCGFTMNLFMVYCKKWRILINLTKTVLKNSREHQMQSIFKHEESWLRWVVLEQVNYYFPFCLYFLNEIVLAHFQKLFGRSNRVYSEKKGKMREGGCVKECFSLTCRLASRNFIIGIISIWTHSNSYFFFLYKMLEKHWWNTFLLYAVI